MMQEIILIGKSDGISENGPSAIIKQLDRFFMKSGIPYSKMIMGHNDSKLRYVWKLITRVILSSGKCINVHTDGLMIPFVVFLLSKINRKSRYYLTVHGLVKKEAENRKMKYNSRFYLLIERMLCRKFDNIICVSKLLKDEINLIYQRKHNICIIENGVDIPLNGGRNKNKYLHTPVRFASFCGININKGVFCLLKIANELRIRNKNFYLNIYGSIQDEETRFRYEQTIEKNELQDCVRYLGKIRKTEVYKVIEKMDFVFTLSKFDTFNMVIIESLALGCPVISSNKCGAYIHITEKNGLVISLDNIDKEIDNIIKLVDRCADESTYLKMIHESRTSVKDVTVTKMGNQYIEVMLNHDKY